MLRSGTNKLQNPPQPVIIHSQINITVPSWPAARGSLKDRRGNNLLPEDYSCAFFVKGSNQHDQ